MTKWYFNTAGFLISLLALAIIFFPNVLYGIPNFKLEKGIIDRRVKVLEAEGVVFKVNVNVGVNYSVEELNAFDSIVLCGGATESRSLPTKGVESKGVVQAMTFLTQQTKSLYGEAIPNQIYAKDKKTDK